MRKFSGRTDILSPLLQERQKPVKKNSMRLKSSVPPAPFVAFSPRTVKVPRNLFSAGCSQQLRERETSQGEPAPLQCSQSLPTSLLKPGESRARDALPERSFPQCKVYAASQHREGCVMLQKTGATSGPFRCSPGGLLCCLCLFKHAQSCSSAVRRQQEDLADKAGQTTLL